MENAERGERAANFVRTLGAITMRRQLNGHVPRSGYFEAIPLLPTGTCNSLFTIRVGTTTAFALLTDIEQVEMNCVHIHFGE